MLGRPGCGFTARYSSPYRWFEEASRKGCPGHRARSIIGMRIHDMLRYALHHGVKTLFLENPDVLGELRRTDVSSYKNI